MFLTLLTTRGCTAKPYSLITLLRTKYYVLCTAMHKEIPLEFRSEIRGMTIGDKRHSRGVQGLFTMLIMVFRKLLPTLECTSINN